jgi:hypothetical protein
VDPRLADRQLDIRLKQAPVRLVLDALVAQLGARYRDEGRTLVIEPIPGREAGVAPDLDTETAPPSVPSCDAAELAALKRRVAELEARLGMGK